MHQKFKVAHTLVGPYPKGHVFTLEDFQERHPVPPGIDGAKYHALLINRLVESGAIGEAKDEEVSAVLPAGPESKSGLRAPGDFAVPAESHVASGRTPDSKPEPTPAKPANR